MRTDHDRRVALLEARLERVSAVVERLLDPEPASVAVAAEALQEALEWEPPRASALPISPYGFFTHRTDLPEGGTMRYGRDLPNGFGELTFEVVVPWPEATLRTPKLPDDWQWMHEWRIVGRRALPRLGEVATLRRKALGPL